jgi:hypothetical protein
LADNVPTGSHSFLLVGQVMMRLMRSGCRQLLARPWWLFLAAVVLLSVLGFLIRDFVFRSVGTFLIETCDGLLLGWPLLIAMPRSGLSDAIKREGAEEFAKLMSVSFIFYELFTLWMAPALAALATSGNARAISGVASGIAAPSSISAASFAAEACLCALAGILTIIPLVLRLLLPWDGASELARRVGPAWLAALGATVTWLYVFLLHFERGLLAGTPLAQLSVAALAAAVLLVPLYRSMARSFWRRGIHVVLNPVPWWGAWVDLRGELRRAFSQGTASGIQALPPGAAADAGPREAAEEEIPRPVPD